MLTAHILASRTICLLVLWFLASLPNWSQSHRIPKLVGQMVKCEVKEISVVARNVWPQNQKKKENENRMCYVRFSIVQVDVEHLRSIDSL